MTNDERRGPEVDLRDVRRLLRDSGREAAASFRRTINTVLIAGAIGGLAGGLYSWLWRGDWGGGLNPLEWNSAARAGFFNSIILGAAAGCVIGLVMAVRRRQR